MNQMYELNQIISDLFYSDAVEGNKEPSRESLASDSENNSTDNESEGGNESDNGTYENENNARPTKHVRKKLTYQRNVSSIDSALDEKNYESMPLPAKVKKMKGIIESKNKKDTLTFKFTNQRPTYEQGRTRRADVVKGKPGPMTKAKETNKPIDAFEKFLTPVMIDMILVNTNRKIEKVLALVPEDKIQEYRYFMRTTSTEELRAFFGLMLYRGMYSLNNYSTETLFSEQFGPPIFGATMSRARYFFILRCLSFDDEETPAFRWNDDRFTVTRELLEMFNNECITCVRATDFISLDETLYPMRTQIGFKQYNPNKPAKYGLLFKSLNSARYPYTYVTSPYAGKPENEDGEWFFPGTENVSRHLINRLDTKQSLEGRNISFDRLYTSFPLTTWLLKEKHVTKFGTLVGNRKGLPKEIKNVADREVLSTEFYWDTANDLILGSYVVDTSKKKKNVMIL